MTKKQYLFSLILQIIALLFIIGLIIKSIFFNITNYDILSMIFWVGVDIVEEIKQQFYKLKNDETHD